MQTQGLAESATHPEIRGERKDDIESTARGASIMGPMAPVEWTRLEGGQVEAVIAMFVNRERPTSVRITPSRGDGGVDILDRGAGEDGTDVVYQVKRYTEKLTSNQKNQIADSLERLLTDDRWEDLTVREWRLVTPWDPSPEAEDWLQRLGPSELRKVWLGLTWADQQASKYEDVVDYYLHDGRARMEKSYAEMMALMGVDHVGSGLSVPDVQARIQGAIEVLDHDPHYRYELRFGYGTLPLPHGSARPGLAMTVLTGTPDGDHWSAVDIVARCAAAGQERPITIEGRFTPPPGSELAEQLDAFFMYGAPFTSQEGSFDGLLDAPGGLGCEISGAAVQVGPTTDSELGENQELHLEILDPGGTSLVGMDVRRTERSTGIGGGARVVLEDEHGLFTIEDRYDLRTHALLRSLELHTWSGKPVIPALLSVRFLTLLHKPNVLRVSVRHTPTDRGAIDRDGVLDWDKDRHEAFRAIEGMLEVLSRIQGHVGTRILTPDFDAVTNSELSSWRRAASLLDGEELQATYPQGQSLRIAFDGEVEVAKGQTLTVLLPFRLKIGDQVVDLGQQEVSLKNPEILDREAFEGWVLHEITTPDRTVQWRRYDDSSADDSCTDEATTAS